MALIECEDCGASVSDQAQMCPNCSKPVAFIPETQVPETELSGWKIYFLGYVIALVVFGVKYGIANTFGFGWMVAFFSWLYVGFALIQAIFT